MSLVGAALLALHGLLGVVMAGSGGTKLVGAEMQVENFERFGYPQWFRVATGGLEALGALCLLVAFATTATLALAGSFLTLVVLTGAIVTHVRVGDPLSEVALPTTLLVVAFVVSLHHAATLA